MKGFKRWIGTVMAVLALSVPASFAECAPAYADSSLRHLSLAVRMQCFSDGDEEGELLRAQWTQVDFLGDKAAFKNIAKALSDYNKQEGRSNRDIRKQMLVAAKQERNERKKAGAASFYPYEHTEDICFRRTDSLAVSFLENKLSYEGGVHGMYGVIGRNFDARTGKELQIEDVITDRKGLAEAVKAQE